jgi:hypothetical protein
MDLEQQIQVLIDNAPQDGTTPKAIEAIAPVLTLLANQLRHADYYILQTLDQDWVLTTLSNRAQPELRKMSFMLFLLSKTLLISSRFRPSNHWLWYQSLTFCSRCWRLTPSIA